MERGFFIGGLLLYGNHRAQTGNLIYIGTLQIAQKVTGISGKRFDIATLALGKYRIECEGRLAASAQPGDYRKAVAGEFPHRCLSGYVHALRIH